MEDDLVYGEAYEEEKTRDDYSHLKFHFMVRNIDLGGSHSGFRQRLIKELEFKVGPVQKDFIHIKPNPTGTACVLFGLRYDTDAERLLRRRVTITVPGNVTAKIEPTDVFKALLDYKLKKRPARKQSPVRSRSPRASPPVMLVLYPPNQITNQEIFSALKDLGVPETPTVEQIFRDIPEVGCKQFIKLTFKHMHSLTKLSSTQLTLKGQPVLLLEPALKDNIQKSVLHAIPHHQVVVRTDGPVSPEELRQVMQQYGPIANVDCANDIVVTYTLLKSAKDALRAQNYSNGELNLTFSKKLA